MNLVLKFVAGKFKGGEFPLKPNREVIIGRSSEFDMVLDEDMVSRQHAKITTFHDQIILMDLGSTNGTQVNGNDIDEVQLKAGDVVTVGRSVMKVVDIGTARPRSEKLSGGQRANDPMRMTLQGIELKGHYPDQNVKVSGLIKQLLRMRKPTSLRLTVSGASDVISMTASGGQLLSARLTTDGMAEPKAGKKALYRAMTWKSGTYEFEPVTDQTDLEPTLPNDIAALVNEARAHRAELEEFRPHLPAMTSRLELSVPLEPQLSNLSAEALDTLQLTINQSTVKAVVDGSDVPELDVWKDVLYLMQSNYIRIAE